MTRRQDIVPGVLELDLDAIDPIAGVLCGARTWALYEGDALELKLPPECADAMIIDPPAGISFMGAKWDSNKGGDEQWIDWLASILRVAFDALKPGAHVLVWSLPRTSYLTALAMRKAGFAIRDTIDHVSGGGFPKSLDISKAIDSSAGAKREVIGIDHRTNSPSGLVDLGRGSERYLPGDRCRATPEAKRWAGWGTALRPNKETWWLGQKPRVKGLTIAANVLRHGVGGLNIDAARVGAAPGSIVPFAAPKKSSGGIMRATDEPRPQFEQHDGGRWPSNVTFQHSSWDEAECRACGVVAPFAVRFCPACGSGDIEAKRGGCRCVGERRVSTGTTYEPIEARPRAVRGAPDEYLGRVVGYADEDGLETIDAWGCLATCERCGDGALVPSGGDAGRCACGFGRRWACAVALLDEQSGSRKTNGASITADMAGMGYRGGSGSARVVEASEGGASRFYHAFSPEPVEPFWYSAKPSTVERESGLDALPKRSGGELVARADGSAGTRSPRAGAGRASGGRANHHPTIKGFHLIGHFCDLLVPPGGLVLDLTAGSGTLGAVVAHRHQATGWRCIMAELDPGHCKIIRERCEHWGARPWRPRAKGAAKPAARAAAPEGQPSLFDGLGGTR